MLVNFFMVEFVADPFLDKLSINLGNNIPIKTCSFFSANTIKFVFCVDAAIVDVADVCEALGLPCEFIHDLEVLEEEYNDGHFVGLKGNNEWHLLKVPEKQVLPTSPFIIRQDPSQN